MKVGWEAVGGVAYKQGVPIVFVGIQIPCELSAIHEIVPKTALAMLVSDL